MGSGGGSGGTVVDITPTQYAADVTLTDGTVDFAHANYDLNENGSVAWQDNGDIVTTTFNVKVIENDLIRVTVLAEYGGRILSIVYKPTNHEMLYQNSVGVPFGAGAGNFYYDWLMVYGGIFPTFPEPEHGKTWFLPWDLEVTANDGDEVALTMSFTDDISPENGVPPERFWYGRTDLTVSATVRVRRGSSAVGLDLTLTNNKGETVPYEYWTCTTLTPGSTPGQTESPTNTEIVVPIDQIFSTYGWVNNVEQSQGENVFAYDKLKNFSEWQDPGILYAHPRMEENYFGVLNRDNNVGIFRVADANKTPGLKFWTWGASSTGTNPEEPDDRRPYIELWAGHSEQFFQPTEIGPNQSLSWTETYLPTLGLDTFTFVNENAAAHLSTTSSGTEVTLSAEVFTALPSITTEVTLLKGEEVLFEEDWTPDAQSTGSFQVAIPSGSISGGEQLGVRLKTPAGDEIYRTAISYSP